MTVHGQLGKGSHQEGFFVYIPTVCRGLSFKFAGRALRHVVGRREEKGWVGVAGV